MTTLLSTRSDELQLRPTVLLDWRDGPIEGVTTIGDLGMYWYFRLFAEYPSSNELDDRIYLLSPIANESVTLIRDLDEKRDGGPMVWPFDGEPHASAIRNAVDKLVASAPAPVLIIRSADFQGVQGIWRLAALRS
jgi:hypothetical protein